MTQDTNSFILMGRDSWQLVTHLKDSISKKELVAGDQVGALTVVESSNLKIQAFHFSESVEKLTIDILIKHGFREVRLICKRIYPRRDRQIFLELTFYQNDDREQELNNLHICMGEQEKRLTGWRDLQQGWHAGFMICPPLENEFEYVPYIYFRYQEGENDIYNEKKFPLKIFSNSATRT